MPLRPSAAVLLALILQTPLGAPRFAAAAPKAVGKRTIYGRVDADASIKVRVKGPQILNIELRAVVPVGSTQRIKGTMRIVRDGTHESAFAFMIPAPRQRPRRGEDTLITRAVQTRIQVAPGDHAFELSVRTPESLTFVIRLTTAKGLGIWELEAGEPTGGGGEAKPPVGETTAGGDPPQVDPVVGGEAAGNDGAAGGEEPTGDSATQPAGDDWPSDPAQPPAGEGTSSEEDWNITVEPSGVDAGTDADVAGLDVRGSVLVQTTAIVSGMNRRSVSGDLSLADVRLGFDVNAWSEAVDASAQFKGELSHDVLYGDFGFIMREGFIDYRLGPLDFRIGRQIVTWGTGEFVFVNDTFPKGWQGYLLGRPMEYFKIGVDGARVRVSTDVVNVEVLAAPVFTPDDIPTSDRFVLFDPVAAFPARAVVLPERELENTDLAVRIDTRIRTIDLAVYGHRGHWRTPSLRFDDPMMPTTAIFFYPKLNSAGVSVSMSILGAVLSLEGAYYDSAGDRDGGDPFRPNSQVRGLASLQASPIADMMVSLQYYLEWMQEYQAYRRSWPPMFAAMKQDEYLQAATIKLTQALLDQRLTLSVFGYWGISQKDYMVQPMVALKISDRFSATFGGTLVDGPRKRPMAMVGQFRKNDNVFVLLSHYF